MLARPVIFGSVMLIDPVDPSTCNSAPCQASKPARVTTNEGTPKRLKRKPWRTPIAMPDRDRGGDRQVGVPAVLDVEDRHHRRGEAADRADREVDLAEQQHVDDADRDQADRGDLQHQVGQVLGREEAVVLELEDRPRSRARPMTTRSEARSPWMKRRSVSLVARGSSRSSAVGASRRCVAHSSPSSIRSACSARSAPSRRSPPTPVIAETTCSSVVCFGLEVARRLARAAGRRSGRRPRRRRRGCG